MLTLFGILFLAYPVGLALVFFCIWWKHKGWTMRDVRLKVMDKAERWVEKRREKRRGKHRKKKNGEPEEDDFEYIEFDDGVFSDEPKRMGSLKRNGKEPKEKKEKTADGKRQAKREERLRKKQEKEQKKEERGKKKGKTGGEW